ncbi:MAG: hypothetical protein CSA22_00290 [Deltaproteobacteria bacterium]|nr:MAG: hypothetical protein CSA22_00290 [Deltaproteobacteria bacterium]
MHPLAEQLNTTINAAHPHLFSMLSDMGKRLFFPKGILSQSAEAKEKAHTINATIGIATEGKKVMTFPSVEQQLNGIPAESALTYASSFGVMALRKAWKEAQLEKNPAMRHFSSSLPVVTCGLTHAISTVADMWVNPGDAILLPDLYWGNYNMVFSVKRGAELHAFPLFSETGGMDIPGFETAVTELAAVREKIIVLLNFPNNPTGYTASKQEGAALVRILKDTADRGKQVIVLLDDAYFGLFFDENSLQESLFGHLATASDRLLAIKMDAATKENYVWGLRVGFITYGIPISGDPAAVYDALEQKTAGCIRGNISNASHLGQTIVLNSLNHPAFASEAQEKNDTLKARADHVKAVLSDTKFDRAWEPYPFNSGYFMCLKLKTVNAEALRTHLLDTYGIGLIAIGERSLRVAFSCLEINQIPALFDRILDGIDDLTRTA